MSNDVDVLFMVMRFNILTFGLSELGKQKLDDAYLYAWDHRVYPLMHDGADWHEPFKDAAGWYVREAMMDEISEYLDKVWKEKNVPTFYELEPHFRGQGKWERAALIAACRYLHLKGLFDRDFWKALLKPLEHPVEAQNIIADFDRDTRVYFM